MHEHVREKRPRTCVYAHMPNGRVAGAMPPCLPPSTRPRELPSPSPLAGALAAVKHLKASGVERAMQQKRVKQLKALVASRGLPLMDNPSHIVPVLVGDPVKCRQLTDALLQTHGIYLQPINFPTVSRGTERVRITPGPLHTEEDLIALVDALEYEWKRLDLAFVKGTSDSKRSVGVQRRSVPTKQPEITVSA